eukprot:s1021_g5.t1
MATSQPEERQGLLTSSIESQQTPVLGGPLVSVPVLFLVVIPAMIATVALQRPWNLISRLLLPLVEIVDSIGAGNTNNCMLIFNQYGKNFCASGEVWLGSHSEVKKSVQNPQGRNYWLGEHPLLPSSVPHGEGGRCVFLLSLASKAVGGTGDHEAFRKCVVDTLLSDASVARESDSISKEVMDSLTADFAKIESGFDFYNSPVGGNQEFWTKYLHHVLFGLDIKNKEVMDTLNSFFTGDMALMHYLYPFGYVPHFNLHSKIEKVAELYEKSPAFKNFKVKAEYNNMTAKELALLMTLGPGIRASAKKNTAPLNGLSHVGLVLHLGGLCIRLWIAALLLHALALGSPDPTSVRSLPFSWPRPSSDLCKVAPPREWRRFFTSDASRTGSPDESAHAARCASHASHASLARSADASLLPSPAEDNQSAPLHVPLLPCTAFATPGTMNASMPAADARALPALPAFSASAASAAHPFASFRPTFLLVLCPFAGIQKVPGPCLSPGPTAPARNGPLPLHATLGPMTSPPGPGAALNAPGNGGDDPGLLAIAQGSGATLNAPGPVLSSCGFQAKLVSNRGVARCTIRDFSCEIAGKTYNFPKGTKVAIPLVFANIDQDVWGADVWDFKHKRPGLEKNHAGFNSVDGVGNRECPGKGLVMRTMVRILQDLGKERRKQKASA